MEEENKNKKEDVYLNATRTSYANSKIEIPTSTFELSTYLPELIF